MNIFKMITFRLCGGLGNQQFQIFTTIAYALKHSKSFFFLNNRQLGKGEYGETIRHTYWDTFLTSMKPMLKNMEQIPELELFYEKDFNINGNYDNILLVGYFQKYIYFNLYISPFSALILNLDGIYKRNVLELDNEKISIYTI